MVARFIVFIPILVSIIGCNQTAVVGAPSMNTSINLSNISALSVSISSDTFNGDSSPNVLITGQFVNGQTINTYSDNNCSDLIGSKVVTEQEKSQGWIKIPPFSPLAAGDYEFSSSVNGGGECKKVEASYRIDPSSPVVSIARNDYAFAALRADGSVKTWGHPTYGGNSFSVSSHLDGTINVTKIVSTARAFAALRADSSVITWGEAADGGDTTAISTSLDGTLDIVDIFSNSSAFAAIHSDGSVITWGNTTNGGNSSAVAGSLDGTINVTSITSNPFAFAAIRSDGSVVTWGVGASGGNSTAVASSLDGTVDVISITSNPGAFAAIRSDGSVVTWGDASVGGNSSSVSGSLNGTIDVTSIVSSSGAFAAIRIDGSVVTWGDAARGADSSGVAASLNGTTDVLSITSNYSAFAAIRADGSVITWGDAYNGGSKDFGGYDGYLEPSKLDGSIDVVSITSSSNAFAAIRSDGSVVTWGSVYGGAIHEVDWNGQPVVEAVAIDGTIDVVGIVSNGPTFAALRVDGSVITWGATDWLNAFIYTGESQRFGQSSFNVRTNLNGTIPVTSIVSSSNGIFVDDTYFGHSTFVGFGAYAAIRGDGSVVCWGDARISGNSVAVSSLVGNPIITVVSNGPASAALRADGSVISWGDQLYGGDSTNLQNHYNTRVSVASHLDGTIKVISLVAGTYGFAALREDGSVVTWGNEIIRSFGDHPDYWWFPSLIDGPVDIISIVSNSGGSYAGIRADGSVVAWGFHYKGGGLGLWLYGGMSAYDPYQSLSAELDGTIDVTTIVPGDNAFFALRGDGSVIAWGFAHPGDGMAADVSPVASQVDGTIDVVRIVSSNGGFTALRADGSIVNHRGSSSALDAPNPSIVSNSNATAEILPDGSVRTSGSALNGGNSSSVASLLNGDIDVTSIIAGNNCFAAIRADGSVVTWGNKDYGGDSSQVAAAISSGVKSIVSTGLGFTAIKVDGSVITWGFSNSIWKSI
jgi:alpha-tubulin suppressor-like RCC1 family protein